MRPDDFHLLMVSSAALIWWSLMKPIAIRMLVNEIDFGVQQLLDEERLLWEMFPIEMDILERDFWAARAMVRRYDPPLLESPYRIAAV